MILRKLTEENVEEILECLNSNEEYNKLSNEEVSLEIAKSLLTCKPLGINIENKILYGFFTENKLIGIADVIMGYPDNKTAFIGLLMIHGNYHSVGYGEQFYKLIERIMINEGYNKIALGVLLNNLKGYNFWVNQNFCLKEVRKRKDTDQDIDVNYMEKEII